MECYVKISLYNRKDAFWRCKIEIRYNSGWECSKPLKRFGCFGFGHNSAVLSYFDRRSCSRIWSANLHWTRRKASGSTMKHGFELYPLDWTLLDWAPWIHSLWICTILPTPQKKKNLAWTTILLDLFNMTYIIIVYLSVCHTNWFFIFL